jgi:hypothetical protein
MERGTDEAGCLLGSAAAVRFDYSRLNLDPVAVASSST